MEQKITIRIAGKDFVLKASGPEEEELIRLAAIDINKRLTAYQTAFPGKALSDILSFVALSEGVAALTFQRKLEAAQQEGKDLSESLETYLSELK